MKIIETNKTEFYILPSGAEWKCECRKYIYNEEVIEHRVFRGWKKRQSSTQMEEVSELTEVPELEIPWFVRNKTIENQNRLNKAMLVTKTYE